MDREKEGWTGILLNAIPTERFPVQLQFQKKKSQAHGDDNEACKFQIQQTK